ncbi:MAG: ketoacyl-ACP synthase III [Bacteroidota bacterium]|nr:MAG: ketoacyl-ACP synthase III [Bacteroidota bacterium]
MNQIYSVIIGTGSYIPERVIKNTDFVNHNFFDESGSKIESPTAEIIEKFTQITEIKERRHVEPELTTSDMAAFASQKAIEKAGIDAESLDYIILAHNFGDLKHNSTSSDILPSLASRVKEILKINNPKTIAYDIIFGCPGWVQAMIQANYYIRSGDAKRVLVIGADILSRISDPHDRDSMIYADGAGATILEARESDVPVGILSHSARTDANGQTYNLFLGKSYNEEHSQEKVYIKMFGRKIYNYALTHVPPVVKESLEKANTKLLDIKKILIHQANAKMDEAILVRLFKLYGETHIPQGIMPMTIEKLGNSSVATVPTLLDLILRGELPNQSIGAGDKIVLASVGAGMNINSVVYQFPA